MLTLYSCKFFESLLRLLDLLKIDEIRDTRCSALDNLRLKYFVLDLNLTFLFFRVATWECAKSISSHSHSHSRQALLALDPITAA